jgi:phosphoglycolate phosphatase-like HAD superfamily hydrolase
MTRERRLILFDIDGTLITSGGAGEKALKEAMGTRFGKTEDFSGIVLAGATDRAIAVNLLRKNHLPASDENVAALMDAYLRHLSEEIGRHAGTVLPGIIPLLEALERRENIVLGLLTGNLVRGAEIKLRHFGVWDFFEFGAFADDHMDRNELGHFARTRATQMTGCEFPPERIFVIGDTPRDIECGRAIGAHTVAIATGQYSVEELQAFHPDFLFETFDSTPAIVAVLAGSEDDS